MGRGHWPSLEIHSTSTHQDPPLGPSTGHAMTSLSRNFSGQVSLSLPSSPPQGQVWRIFPLQQAPYVFFLEVWWVSSCKPSGNSHMGNQSFPLNRNDSGWTRGTLLPLQAFSGKHLLMCTPEKFLWPRRTSPWGELNRICLWCPHFPLITLKVSSILHLDPFFANVQSLSWIFSL